MKTTYGWFGGGSGTNTSGFSCLPGGFRGGNNGDYFDAGDYGYWWSSSPTGASAWSRYLVPNDEIVYRYNGLNRRYGFSVRCIRDAE